VKLYHFTKEKNLESIARKGLLSRVPKEPLMTLGLPVVWLTARETEAATEEDLEHFQSLPWVDEKTMDEVRQHGLLLNTGRTHRLTVRVRSDKKVINYGEFVRQHADTVILDEDGMANMNDAGELYSFGHSAECMSKSALTSWFLYFGRIPPSKIEGLPSIVSRSKRQKQSVEADIAQLDNALNKFIGAETATWTPPEARGRQ
jgi:hypothetical protein